MAIYDYSSYFYMLSEQDQADLIHQMINEFPTSKGMPSGRPNQSNFASFIKGAISHYYGKLQSSAYSSPQQFNFPIPQLRDWNIDECLQHIQVEGVNPPSKASFISVIKNLTTKVSKGFGRLDLTFDEPTNISSKIQEEIFEVKRTVESVETSSLNSSTQNQKTALKLDEVRKYLLAREFLIYEKAIKIGPTSVIETLNAKVAEKMKGTK
jgi:hypothetical protein